MDLNVALVGNPNCGKTTLFNALTGSNQYVGNWPGVTVEQKKGKLKGHDGVQIVDLPGIYSLSPYTLEEVVARDYLIKGDKDGKAGAVINIVDGSNLERNLYLSTQAIELGLPTVIAVNMIDVVNKNGDKIDLDALSAKMGCPVVEISALQKTGIDELVSKIMEVANGKVSPKRVHAFADDVESSLSQIEDKLPADVPAAAKRFFAVKLFERDSKIAENMSSVPSVEQIVKASEAAHDDDSESIIVNERYDYISRIIDGCYTKANANAESVSDKIDKIVTNRWLALPIFAVVMFLVYFISVTTVGGVATDWANDGVFGDGWFADVKAIFTPDDSDQAAFDEANEPFDEANTIVETWKAGETFYVDYDDETGEGESVDITEADYDEAVAFLEENEEPDPSDYGLWIPGIPALIEMIPGWDNVNELVQGLIMDGIVGGVGAVLGFLPQMLVLFFFLAFLEGCGYMSRVAFILDRIFRRFGLSGKSFIPILIGTGCGVPGIMASRTIENENDRRMTVMTTTFIPCGAKLPIIALFAGAVFGGAWWVAPSAYFLGIAAILLSGIILKKTRFFAGKAAPFVMELPSYHMPTLGSILRSMGERCAAFVKKAGTIILAAAILIWILSTFGPSGVVEDQADSFLAIFGNAIAWIFIPLGWGNWQAAAATVTGLIAKENVVGTFGVLYAGGAGWFANVQAAYTPVVAYSFMAFNLLCAPCFAAMGAIRKEMNGGKWFWAAIGYQCGLAYLVALVVYQLGGLVTGECGFNFFTIVAIAVAAAALFLLFRPNKYSDVEGTMAVAANA